jgi:hypothetical protein
LLCSQAGCTESRISYFDEKGYFSITSSASVNRENCPGCQCPFKDFHHHNEAGKQADMLMQIRQVWIAVILILFYEYILSEAMK